MLWKIIHFYSLALQWKLKRWTFTFVCCPSIWQYINVYWFKLEMVPYRVPTFLTWHIDLTSSLIKIQVVILGVLHHHLKVVDFWHMKLLAGRQNSLSWMKLYTEWSWWLLLCFSFPFSSGKLFSFSLGDCFKTSSFCVNYCYSAEIFHVTSLGHITASVRHIGAYKTCHDTF